MGQYRDWMPSRREERLVMARTWLSLFSRNSTKWGIPSDLNNVLDGLIEGVADEEHDIQSQGRTPALTERLNQADRALTAFMRDTRDRYFKLPPLDNSDIISLGLRPRDTIRTPHIEVTEVVEFEIRLRNIRELLVNFWIKGAVHRAKPDGYDGAVIIWDVLDSPPADPDALNNHTMASRTPHAIEFREEDRGKTAYIAAAWQNERGNIGLWSEILSAVIP